MSSRVKQANFRLPLEYMAMIDEFAARSNLTKAGVITRALDCMKASYESGHGGMPITGLEDNAAELKDLRDQLAIAQSKISSLEAREKRVPDLLLVIIMKSPALRPSLRLRKKRSIKSHVN